MVFKGICFVLLIMMTSNATAQYYENLSQEEKEQKSIALINEADAFILGTPVSYECFYGKDGKTIYTKVKIKVKHWYKGEGNRIIYLINKGGVVGTDRQVNNNKPRLHLDDEQFMVLSKEGENYRFTKNIKASFGRYSDSHYDDFKIISFYDMKFNSIDDLNGFVKNLQGIKVPNKKKDVGFQESSEIEPPIIIDEDWLAAQGPLHAGVGEILTIKGQNFGNKGDILFMDANDPTRRLDKLENEYIVDWTPNEIQVIIPSLVEEGFSGENYGVAGSGTIVVKRAPGLFTPPPKESFNKINIEYALINGGTITNNTYDISQGYLGREHCLNGFVFTLHESFMGNNNAINVVEAALLAWSNELGITLQLEEEADGVYYFHNSTTAPYRNLIRFDPSMSGLDMMSTFTTEIYDDNPGPDKLWLSQSEITIRTGDIWNYSLSGYINYEEKLDFYENILHEIGHALGLDHSIELHTVGVFVLPTRKNLMYAISRTTGEALDSDRTDLNQHSDGARAGAQRVATDSRAHNWTAAFTEEHGVETLAASGVNSYVQPTPELEVTAWYIPIDPANAVPGFLIPSPITLTHDYYWLPNGVESFTYLIQNLCERSRQEYRVRVKNATCSVSSLYSLPFTTPVKEYCDRRNRDDMPSSEPLLVVYPNPTKGNFNIQFKPIESEEMPEMENVYIGIYDNLGKLQHQHQVSDATLRQTTIDISTLPAGMYWVVWFADGEVIDTQQVQKTD